MKTSITGQSHYKYERGKRLRWSRQLSISGMIRKGPLTTTACTERQIGVLTCQKVIINWIALVGSFIFITAVCHPFKGMRIQTIGIYIPCMAIYGQTPMSPVYSFTFLFFSFEVLYTSNCKQPRSAQRDYNQYQKAQQWPPVKMLMVSLFPLFHHLLCDLMFWVLFLFSKSCRPIQTLYTLFMYKPICIPYTHL